MIQRRNQPNEGEKLDHENLRLLEQRTKSTAKAK